MDISNSVLRTPAICHVQGAQSRKTSASTTSFIFHEGLEAGARVCTMFRSPSPHPPQTEEPQGPRQPRGKETGRGKHKSESNLTSRGRSAEDSSHAAAAQLPAPGRPVGTRSRARRARKGRLRPRSLVSSHKRRCSVAHRGLELEGSSEIVGFSDLFFFLREN